MSKREYWQTRLKEWEDSNLNCKQFCAENELSYSNFMSWKRKLTQQVVRQEFVELIVDKPLKFRCGQIDLTVDSNLENEQLSQIIAASHRAHFIC